MQHALNYNPPKRLAPWSIELLCMRDEEVFSFSIPFFHFQCPALNWNSVSLQYCLCRFWKLWNWGSNNFPRTIVDWYTGFNFSFNFCGIYFLTPIFWRLTFSQSNWVLHRKVRIQAICVVRKSSVGHLLCVLDNMFLNVLGIGITLTWNRSELLLRSDFLLRSGVYAVECEV